MLNIPEKLQDLLSNESKAHLFLATINSDGSPQVTPVWFNTDEDHILINTAVGRIKDKNMRNRENVALCIADPADPYRYIQIQGKVVSHTTEGADEHIDALCLKYTGQEKYPWRKPNEQRVTYKILPIKIDAR
ncbi:MAG: PPOX class F420-dependent oxidoreductase [Anaerolineales bacterium]|nr:PPOX class F420-dependent oxidoreductase [Anaerolineales bacterium]MBP6209624.1 PPOX class F420-dependent oxidoreductase [Anaerolineales bacterium]MBP8164880.1 PPOX class F420-dependent oxidoreductase [Anaerolineales bacterium]